ncbi:MAG: class I SAM-dependent methyltransferase, partial [Chloroflexota bacterium]
ADGPGTISVTDTAATPLDVDAILAEVRERIRRKRESGMYGPEVEAALRLPLPGGRPIFTEELGDPVPALADALDEPVEYDPRSRKPIVGVFITLARRVVMGLVRWWITDIEERRDRIDRLLARAVVDIRRRPSPEFGDRLARLEIEWKRFREDRVGANLHSTYFQARFGGTEEVIRAQSERFLDHFRGRARVLDLGSGRGIFLQLMRDHGVGAYGIDMDPRMVETARGRHLEVHEADAVAHLRELPDKSVDGLYARHLAEHILPGELVEILRQCRRVLRPGSPVVFVTPNPATLTVGAHTFWTDPGHLRPIPPDLFRFYLEVEGFVAVDLVTFEPTEGPKLSEDVGDGAMRDNVRLLNELLFGDRDYAVIGRTP